MGVGSYRAENGEPYVFPVVRHVEQRIAYDSSLDNEWTPTLGTEDFNKGARGVLFGCNHPDVTSGRVASSQTLSGNGALRIISEFIHKFRPAPIYVSDPTWGNDVRVFEAVGIQVRYYRYFD